MSTVISDLYSAGNTVRPRTTTEAIIEPTPPAYTTFGTLTGSNYDNACYLTAADTGFTGAVGTTGYINTIEIPYPLISDETLTLFVSASGGKWRSNGDWNPNLTFTAHNFNGTKGQTVFDVNIQVSATDHLYLAYASPAKYNNIASGAGWCFVFKATIVSTYSNFNWANGGASLLDMMKPVEVLEDNFATDKQTDYFNGTTTAQRELWRFTSCSVDRTAFYLAHVDLTANAQAELTKYYSASLRTTTFLFKYDSNNAGVTEFGTLAPVGGASDDRGSVQVDFVNKKVYNQSMSLTWTSGKFYYIKIYCGDYLSQITVTQADNASNTWTSSYINVPFTGRPYVKGISGTFSLYGVNISICGANALMAFSGDSITADKGTSIKDRFMYRFRHNGIPTIPSAAGNSNYVASSERLLNEMRFLKPSMFITNDLHNGTSNAYVDWAKSFCNSYGIKYIHLHINPFMNTDSNLKAHVEYALSNCDNIRADYGLSVNGDPAQGQDQQYFMSSTDKAHINTLGSAKVYDAINSYINKL